MIDFYLFSVSAETDAVADNSEAVVEWAMIDVESSMTIGLEMMILNAVDGFLFCCILSSLVGR